MLQQIILKKQKLFLFRRGLQALTNTLLFTAGQQEYSLQANHLFYFIAGNAG